MATQLAVGRNMKQWSRLESETEINGSPDGDRQLAQLQTHLPVAAGGE